MDFEWVSLISSWTLVSSLGSSVYESDSIWTSSITFDCDSVYISLIAFYYDLGCIGCNLVAEGNFGDSGGEALFPLDVSSNVSGS